MSFVDAANFVGIATNNNSLIFGFSKAAGTGLMLDEYLHVVVLLRKDEEVSATRVCNLRFVGSLD